jgi:predicted RNA binding protein YcfA (HicA-like mRNA interferase family)
MADHPAAGLLRNASTRRIVRALERDGFKFTERQGSQRIYRHGDGRRVVVHYHRANDTLPP